MPYKVNEIFYSIQGEGMDTGVPAVFIRFSGCNRQCEYCDTDHENINMIFDDPEALAKAAKKCDVHESDVVILTGGEPLLQVDKKLIRALGDYFNHISIETNGTIGPTDDFYEYCPGMDITVSPKLGDKWSEALIPDYIKVVDEDQDLDIYTDFYEKNGGRYFLQPKWPNRMEGEPESSFNERIKASLQKTATRVMENPRWTLSLQTHKWIGIR